jgi:hypothetical protein
MSATDTPAAPKVDENLLQHDNKVFFKFVTISHPETLTRFTNDVNVMVAQAQKIVELNQRIQSALTTTEKDAVTKLREAELLDFNQKDAVFEKVYGFKMDTVAIRPHFIQNQAIQLMSPVTDEQIAELRKNPEFKENEVVARGNQKMIQLCKMTGEHIPLFERNINIVQAQQNALLQLRAAEQTATDEAAKKRAQEEIAKVTETLTQNAEHMGKTYGIFSNNIVFDVLEAKFWVALTQDEVKAYVEKTHGAAPAAAAPIAIEAPKAEKKAEKKN